MAAHGIYLIGFSGAGKSTVARLVGAHLGWPVHDVDSIIEQRSGTPIPQIFEREGEAGFRAHETEALRAVSETAPFVVATGGGAAMRIENRQIMARTGWVIALEGRPETLHSRMQQQLAQAAPDAVRPMLDAADPLRRIRVLKGARQPVYALADWTVHTDRLSTAQVVAEVVRAVELLEHTATPVASFDAPV